MDINQAKKLVIRKVDIEDTLENYVSTRLEDLYIETTTSINDSSLILNKAKKLQKVSIIMSNFSLEITDTLPNLTRLSIAEKQILNSNLDTVLLDFNDFRVNKTSYIDARLLPKLETLSVYCENCQVILPNKIIKFLKVNNSILDTFYVDSSSNKMPQVQNSKK